MYKSSRWDWVRALACGTALVVLWACGGSGGTSALTVRDVSNAVAEAKTLDDMDIAFEALFTLLALPKDSQKRDVWMTFAEPTFYSGGAQIGTFQQVYDRLETRLKADPRSAQFALDLTAQEFLDIVNSRLPAAYSAPNSPANAPYVLFSSIPGQIPATAPLMAPTDRMTLFQTMMFTEVRGSIYVELNPVEPPALVTAAGKGTPRVGLGTASDCTDACDQALETCGQTCIAQFQNDEAEAIQAFKDFVVPRLQLVVVAIGAVQSISSLLIEGCNGDQACIDNINAAVEEGLVLFTQLLADALAVAADTYGDQIAAVTRELEQCGNTCGQQHSACLDACHNQGGG